MITMEQLDKALDRVWKRNGKPGTDGVTVDAFERSGDIKRLAREIQEGSYRMRPAKTFKFPKPNGGERVIAVLCVRDRIAHCAIASQLSSMVDPLLSEHSHAYRYGRSCNSAVSVIRRSGCTWIAAGDVANYFDNIDQAILISAVSGLAGDKMARLARACIEPVSSRGIPQGSSLSPVLSNIYLDAFDRRMAAHGTFVRYSDNFAFASDTEDEARTLLNNAAAELGNLGLALNGKSGVFRASGFTYLGERLK